MKKVLTTSLVVLCAATSSAGAVNFSGGYIGGAIDRHMMSNKSSMVDTSSPTRSYDVKTPNKSRYGFAVLAGYGKQFSSDVYVGIEGQANIMRNLTLTGVNTAQQGTEKVTIRPVFGVSARLGYVMDDFMPYVLAGFEAAKVRGNYSYDGSSSSTSGSRIGRKLGAGLEYAINDNLRLRGEYSVTRYNPVYSSASTSAGSVYNTQNLRDRNIRVGLVYTF